MITFQLECQKANTMHRVVLIQPYNKLHILIETSLNYCTQNSYLSYLKLLVSFKKAQVDLLREKTSHCTTPLINVFVNIFIFCFCFTESMLVCVYVEAHILPMVLTIMVIKWAYTDLHIRAISRGYLCHWPLEKLLRYTDCHNFTSVSRFHYMVLNVKACYSIQNQPVQVHVCNL